MEDIVPLLTIDYSAIFVSVFTILIGLKAIVSIFEWVINKLGIETKWMRNRREESELLKQTVKNLTILQRNHEKDVKDSNEHDKQIKEDLSIFMDEMRCVISETQKEIKQFAENRLNDREQSRKIQKELTDSIKAISDNEKERRGQIESLMCGSKELLGAEIDKRYREYILLDGIPELEVSEFDDIFVAYKRLNGNHTRDTKYDYVKNHLRVIPVETKLIMNEK
jgi:hypothetical protein